MKVYTYMIIMITMLMFLSFMGIPTAASDILEKFGIVITDGNITSGDLSASSFFSWLFDSTSGVIAIVTLAGAVIVGFLTRQFDFKLVLVSFMVWVAGVFAASGWMLVNYATETWLKLIVATIFIPLTVAFVWGIVELFGGYDQ